MEELALQPEELKNVRVAAFLDKRARSFPHGWRPRYCVLAGNFLFIYKSPSDPKPKRVVCVDDAVAEPCERYRSRKHAFTLVSRTGKVYTFAAESREDRDKWLACMANAGYAPMYMRTREAVRFLERCKDAVATFLAESRGVPVPPPSALLPPPLGGQLGGGSSASLAQGGGSRGSGGAGDGGGAPQLPPTSAASQPPPPPASGDPRFTAYMALRSALSGAEILDSLGGMRAAAEEARGTAGRLRDENDALKAQVESQAGALAQALARLEAVSPASGGGGLAGLARERDELRRQVEGLSLSSAGLANKVNDLTRELQAATAAAAAARAAAAAPSAPSSSSSSSAGDAPALRARVRELEAALASAQQQQQQAGSGSGISGAAGSLLSSPLAGGGHASSGSSGSGLSAGNFLSSGAGAAPAAGGVLSPPASTAPPRSAAGLGAGAGGGSGGAAAAAGSASARGVSGGATGGGVSSSDPSAVYEHEWAPFAAEAQRLEAAGRLPEAELAYRSVLELKADRCGGEAPAVGGAHRDLGRVLSLQGRHGEAEGHYAACVRLCGAGLGEAHPSTACALTDLAAVLREQGKFGEAEAFAVRAVDSLRAGVGADDVSTATAWYNLAGLAKRQAKWGDAEAAYGEALRVFRARLGEGAGETADTLYQMGCLHRKRGEHARAGALFGQAADSYASAYGRDDKRVSEASKRARAMADKGGGGTPSRR